MFIPESSTSSLLSIGTCDIAYWDLQHGQLKFSVEIGHSIDFAILSPTDSLVVCGSADSGVVVVISLTHGSIVHKARAEEYYGMTDLLVSGDHIFIATPSAGVLVRSLTQNVFIGNLHKPGGASLPTRLLANSHNERQIFVGYQCGTVCVFDTDPQTVVYSMSGHSGRINSLHLLPSGQLISAGDDHRAVVWNHQLCVNSSFCIFNHCSPASLIHATIMSVRFVHS